MKHLLTILTLVVPLMFSSTSFAHWIKVRTNNAGTDFYLNHDRAREQDGYIYYWVLIDYLKPTSSGHLSMMSHIQGDCGLLRTKTLTEHLFLENLGRGNPKITEPTKSQKQWVHAPPNSITKAILNGLCIGLGIKQD